ncbi:flagellar biosynthetic protein FliR [Rhizomicrobium palustre]|uniref:Flagellar biosynthetic protein FliR n=1 Tax=Rhizomicrobium palustre TaxID=189966 RepID=A0A846MZ78_9PROT|nr:flagellar biosynthetic protein FliR [Rhizomicrobium palustre]NIK88312.1 flagellar biosynthetic protein FliR [Rhizomicrobium palustre]
MHITLPALSGAVLVYLLVFSRCGAMLMLLPPIGDINVPSRVRLMLALAVTMAMAPTVSAAYPAAAPKTAIALAVMIGMEVTAGVLIGTLARIIMSSINIAGSMIANQMGLSFAESLDPTSHGQQGAVIGNFLSMLAVVLIFSANLHHLAIGAVAGSYHLIPPGSALPTADMAELAIRLVSGSFALGFQLSAPFIVFGFAVNAGFGVLARMQPQLQVFFIATPFNILVGFVMLTLIIGTMMTIFLNFYGQQMAAFL